MKTNKIRYIKILISALFSFGAMFFALYFLPEYNKKEVAYTIILVNSSGVSFFAFLFAFVEIAILFFNFKGKS